MQYCYLQKCCFLLRNPGDCISLQQTRNVVFSYVLRLNVIDKILPCLCRERELVRYTRDMQGLLSHEAMVRTSLYAVVEVVSAQFLTGLSLFICLSASSQWPTQDASHLAATCLLWLFLFVAIGVNIFTGCCQEDCTHLSVYNFTENIFLT